MGMRNKPPTLGKLCSLFLLKVQTFLFFSFKGSTAQLKLQSLKKEEVTLAVSNAVLFPLIFQCTLPSSLLLCKKSERAYRKRMPPFPAPCELMCLASCYLLDRRHYSSITFFMRLESSLHRKHFVSFKSICFSPCLTKISTSWKKMILTLRFFTYSFCYSYLGMFER